MVPECGRIALSHRVVERLRPHRRDAQPEHHRRAALAMARRVQRRLQSDVRHDLLAALYARWPRATQGPVAVTRTGDHGRSPTAVHARRIALLAERRPGPVA